MEDREPFGFRAPRGSGKLEPVGKQAMSRTRPRVMKRDKHIVDMARNYIMSLPREQPCFPEIKRLLTGFTASALAALLKDLASQGMADRAYEVFHDLHALGPDHPMAHLLDVYTFTTIISQCESSQSVERALQLIQMMKERGIECNVHTYSALMKVCIRANNLELALATYDRILEAGLSPTLITYNTLIDVLGSKGDSKEVIKMLKTIKARGLNPEVRTYNMAIRACVRAGSLDHALQAYTMLLEDGKEPCASTFTSLVTLFGKEGRLDACKEIFATMENIGIKGDVMTYSSMINACAKAGAGKQALDVFHDMIRQGIQPTIITFNCLLEACATEGLSEEAEWLYCEIPRHNLVPDVVTVRALYKVYAATGLWFFMLSHYVNLDQPALMEDSGLFNRVLDDLWGSGCHSAQVAALRLAMSMLTTRHKQLLQQPSSSILQWICGATTPGAAIVCILILLSRLSTCAPALATMPAGSDITLLFTHGRPNQPGTSGFLLSQTVAAMLTKSKVPSTCFQVWGGMQVSFPATPVVEWLQSASAAAFLRVALEAEKCTGPLVDVARELAFDASCTETFRELITLELQVFDAEIAAACPPRHDLREMAVFALSQQEADEGLDVERAYHAIFLLDVFFRTTPSFDTARLPRLLEAALEMAREPESGSPQAVIDDEDLKALEKGRMCCSPMQMVDFYLRALQLQGDGGPPLLRAVAVRELPKLFCCSVCAMCSPSLVAAAFLVVLRQDLGLYKPWPGKLQALTSYLLDPVAPHAWRNRHNNPNSQSHLWPHSSDASSSSGAPSRNVLPMVAADDAPDGPGSLMQNLARYSSLHAPDAPAQGADARAALTLQARLQAGSQGAYRGNAYDPTSADEGFRGQAIPKSFQQLVNHIAALLNVSMKQDSHFAEWDEGRAWPDSSRAGRGSGPRPNNWAPQRPAAPHWHVQSVAWPPPNMAPLAPLPHAPPHAQSFAEHQLWPYDSVSMVARGRGGERDEANHGTHMRMSAPATAGRHLTRPPPQYAVQTPLRGVGDPMAPSGPFSVPSLLDLAPPGLARATPRLPAHVPPPPPPPVSRPSVPSSILDQLQQLSFSHSRQPQAPSGRNPAGYQGQFSRG